MFGPIMDMRALTAVGPRVGEDAIGLVSSGSESLSRLPALVKMAARRHG
jgi:hypothetical protein